MKAKQNAGHFKAKWQLLRARYTWHLRPPFQDEFDCTHWWAGKSADEIRPVAALYELARRHPRIGTLRVQLRSSSWYGQELRKPLIGHAKEKLASKAFDDLGQEPTAIHCLCLIGLRSWPTLDWRSQAYWEMSAGHMKGVDCRDALSQCSSITSDALCDLMLKRLSAMKTGKKSLQFLVGKTSDSNQEVVSPVDPAAFQKSLELVANDVLKNPIPQAELEAVIAQHAIAAHRQGHWLFAVASDLTSERAASLLAQTYRHEQSRHPYPKNRARWENWLPLIATFENADNQTGGAKSQSFTSYRRVMDTIEFNPPTPQRCVGNSP
jgi:hypothetical protein